MSNVTNDPIADMLTRIRNALTRGMTEVVVPKSTIKIEIARILKEEGYIEDYSIGDESPIPLIKVQLKYFRDPARPAARHHSAQADQQTRDGAFIANGGSCRLY